MAWKWRKTFRVVHRDMGYATAALVIAYSISGLAVNHAEDWNPNYDIEEVAVELGPLPTDSYDAMEAHVVAGLNLDPALVRGRLMDTETVFRLYLPEGSEVRVDIRDGKGTMKTVRTRFFLYEVNALHLNNLKGIWTYIADLFAIALLFLAITGIFIHKGRQGLAGRGKWFLGAGLLIPVVFIGHMYGLWRIFIATIDLG